MSTFWQLNNFSALLPSFLYLPENGFSNVSDSVGCLISCAVFQCPVIITITSSGTYYMFFIYILDKMTDIEDASTLNTKGK